MNKSNPLAQEITAQIQLGLYGTVGSLARQLRAIDRIAPRLKEGGIVRKLQVDRDRSRRSVGLSASNRNIIALVGFSMRWARWLMKLPPKAPTSPTLVNRAGSKWGT